MKRQFNLNLFNEKDTLELSLDKLIGTNHAPASPTLPKLQSEAALSLSELSVTIDSWCEAILHSDEDILLSSSTNDFIDKYAVEALTSIDELLARYSTTSFSPSKPQSEENEKIDFTELLKGF